MKKLTVIYIALFVAMLLLPAVAMPFFTDDGASENRELSEFPDIKKEDGGFNFDFTSELDLWISEHIGFRRKMVEANSRWQAAIFGKSSEDSVIVGRDGWLFYAETEADYLNAATLSTRNIQNIVRTLELMQEYAESHGATFTAAIVPNKNTLYGEAMPYYYLPLHEDGNLELLEAALAGSNVNYADIRAAFSETDEVLYQKLDSHWDYRGALLGYRTIMEKTGRPYEKFDGLTFEARTDWRGDLSVMLYSDAASPDVQYYPEYEFGHRFVSHEKNEEAITLKTANQDGTGVLFMFRDSFCNTMRVYFSENFAEATFSRAYPFRMDRAADSGADVCVLEIVERNLPNLAKRAPVMEAPEAVISAEARALPEGAVTVEKRTQEGYLHIYGVVDGSYLGDSYRAYILVSGGGKSAAYEAFPIFEQELLGADTLGDNGFSAYLDGGLIGDADSMRIIVAVGDTFYISGEHNIAE